MESASKAIEVRGLSFEYGSERDGFKLEVPTLEVAAGESLALVGPSGSGKSTLLNLLAGILIADQGSVSFEGHDWASLPDARRRQLRISRIGLVFQEFELLEHLSVEENVLLPYLIHPSLRVDSSVREHVGGLLEGSGIARYGRRKPRDLSQGERQRVALCRALATRPALVLADEPTGNLDPETSRTVLGLLQEAVRGQGASLVMVTHDHGLLDAFPRVVDLQELKAQGRA